MLKSIVSGDNENIDVISVVAGNTSTDGRSSSVINEDVIKCEILTGLPVKSLMRFKCVSKSWLSLIEEDPSFTDLHLARPALLLVIPRTPRRDPNNPYNLNLHRNIHDQLVLTANLIRDQGSEGEVHSTRKIKSSQSSGILGPVNGLVCFVNQDKSVVCVYNLSTRERTPGVKSTLHLSSEEQSAGFSLHKIYEFGFDPVTKKHKVLCICHRLFQQPGQLSTYADNQVCEVLTVGDNAWRRIDEFLPWGIDYILPSSVYVNGYIYYCTDKFLSCSWYGGWQNGDAVLVAFDVSIEKFRTITIPNLILRSPPSDDWFNQHADLLEVNGHVAISCRYSAYVAKIWVYREDTEYDDNGRKTISTNMGTFEEKWTEHTIALPFSWNSDVAWSFYTGPEMHQIVILPEWLDIGEGSACITYYYDLNNKTFTAIEVSRIPSSVRNGSYMKFSTFFGSLLPINQKQRRS